MRLTGDISRIELFARQTVPGWDVWGNDVGGAEPPPRGDGPGGEAPRSQPATRASHGTANSGAVAAGRPRRRSPESQALCERILAHIRAHGPASRRDMVDGLGLSVAVVKTLLASLIREGVVAKRGRTRATRYELAGAREPRGEAGAEEVRGQLPLRPRGS